MSTATPSTAQPSTLEDLRVRTLRALVARASERHLDEADRIRRGAGVALLAHIAPRGTEPGGYWVEACDQTTYYAVDLKAGSCECADYQHRQRRCKHQWGVRLLRAALRLEACRQRAQDYGLVDVDAPISYELTPQGEAFVASLQPRCSCGAPVDREGALCARCLHCYLVYHRSVDAAAGVA